MHARLRGVVDARKLSHIVCLVCRIPLGEDQPHLEILPEVIRNYGLAVQYGHRHIFQSLPRLLTLWFDFGSHIKTITVTQKVTTCHCHCCLLTWVAGRVKALLQCPLSHELVQAPAATPITLWLHAWYKETCWLRACEAV